jgi:hypothetical protein
MSYRSIASKLLSLLLIIASNPLLLAITVGICVIFLAFGIGFILYYNLATAIMFLAITGGAILLLDAIHVVKIKEYPMVLAIPFIMALVGYGGQNLKFDINGQPTALLDSTIAINPNATNPAAWVLLEVFIAVIVIVVVATVVKKMLKK